MSKESDQIPMKNDRKSLLEQIYDDEFYPSEVVVSGDHVYVVKGKTADPLRFLLSSGNRNDICITQTLLESFDLRSRLILADKGYGSDKFVRWVKERGGIVVISSCITQSILDIPTDTHTKSTILWKIYSSNSKATTVLPLDMRRRLSAFMLLSALPVPLFGTSALFVYGSLVVSVIALSSAFGYTCFTFKGKATITMAETKNLCAQISLDLHRQICEAKEQSGLTTAQYITNLLIEYYEMKKNGGNTTMANSNTRTMAFQIPEELFQRIKAHLERESVRTGRKLTQKDFVLGLIEEVLEAAERQIQEAAGVSPCEAPEAEDDPQPPEDK